jgi:hypothetical protein
LHPLFEGEVVDTASFGDTVRQEPKNIHSSAHVRFHTYSALIIQYFEQCTLVSYN